MADTSLRKLFENKLNEWNKSKGEAVNRALMAALMEWGSVVPGGTLWESIERQIFFKAEKYDVPPERIVGELFEQENADMFMFLLQA